MNNIEENPVFTIQLCHNCPDHKWHTNHDESKYKDYFKRMSDQLT